MHDKRKLLEKFLKYIKRKKFPKQLSVLLVIIFLLFIYILDYIQKLYKVVCFRKRVILSSVLIIILALFTITYSFYYNRQTNRVLAGTVSDGNEAKIQNDLNEITVPEVPTANTSIEGMNPYYIKVNREQNCVTIYTYDDNREYTVPIKAMICSTGGDNTPLGVFDISEKYEFKALLYNVYGQYATRIKGQILFHSVSYDDDEKDTLIAEEFNKLGEGVSHGCIRLSVIDAKWIYDNCDSGTVVEIYDDKDPGPLGKPSSITVPENSVWDPTDPDTDNPWNNAFPVFEGIENKQIQLGKAIDLLDGIKAYDTCGNDITEQIKVSGSVNVNVPGNYMVSYSVIDLLGKMVISTATYTVIEK